MLLPHALSMQREEEKCQESFPDYFWQRVERGRDKITQNRVTSKRLFLQFRRVMYGIELCAASYTQIHPKLGLKSTKFWRTISAGTKVTHSSREPSASSSGFSLVLEPFSVLGWQWMCQAPSGQTCNNTLPPSLQEEPRKKTTYPRRKEDKRKGVWDALTPGGGGLHIGHCPSCLFNGRMACEGGRGGRGRFVFLLLEYLPPYLRPKCHCLESVSQGRRKKTRQH